MEDGDTTFCFEPLSENQTNFINRGAAAVQLVDAVAHPRIATMLDGYSLSWEENSPDTVIRPCGQRLRHFHADDETKRGPGQGKMDYRVIAAGLIAIDYDDWVSVETHDGETDLVPLVEDWCRYLKSCWA